MLVHHLTEAAQEWWTTYQQFVGHDGEGILVGGRCRLPCPLFGGHVCGGASNRLADIGSRATELGDAKISQEQVWTAEVLLIALNEKVRGFDILMNDLMVMCMLQCTRCLADNGDNLLRRKWV